MRKIRLRDLRLLLLVLSFALTMPAAAQTPPTRADAAALLRQWQQTHLVVDSAIDRYRPLGKRALDLFAPFLLDKDLGYYAGLAMQQLDATAATPYLLKVLPQEDPNTQAETFRAAGRALMEYAWYERAGKPPPKPGETPPRYPRSTKPYPYTHEIHAAALAILQKGGNDRKWYVFQAIGLTGSRRDIPLLRRYVAEGHPALSEDSDWYGALAALARLGDKQALDWIAAELEKPVHTKPAERYSHDGQHWVEPSPGAVVVTPEEARRLLYVINLAAFSMNRRFVPLLACHLEDPPGQFYGDSSDPSPAEEACMALGQMVEGTESLRPVDYWQRWWKAHNAGQN